MFCCSFACKRLTAAFSQFPWAALTGGLYWQQRDINQCADANDIVCATERVNGGTNGLATREFYW
jgi:predicted chitinase